jgi:hypothetical protein
VEPEIIAVRGSAELITFYRGQESAAVNFDLSTCRCTASVLGCQG